MTKKIIFNWEIAGFIFICVTGTLLHFVFEWSGYWRPIAWFAPVNESVWEHFKLAFWPASVFALLEYALLRKLVNNFWIGKSLALLVMPFLIGTLFYVYTGLGFYSFIGNVLFFYFAAAIGQWISFKLFTSPQMSLLAQQGALVLILILVTAFVLLSYFPPHIFLFEDVKAQQYGIFK